MTRPETTPVRVLSIPAGHPYVRHALGGAVGVNVLPDSPVPGAAEDVWWPHRGLEPAWVQDHRSEFDVVHVHFGFEHRTMGELQDWVRQLRQLQVPLVVTVHDLWLPHSPDQAEHLARVRVLVEAAAAVLTLTPGAAATVDRLFGVRSTVVSHPRMASFTEIDGAARHPGTSSVVALHLKSLRANAGGAELVRALVRCIDTLGSRHDLTLRLDAHRELRQDRASGRARELVLAMEEAGRLPFVDVRWGDRLDDAQLHEYFRAIDISVVPHRWGTHSGWLEECLDLGVVPIVPEVGHLREQAPVPSYRWISDAPDEATLATALEQAHARAGRGRSTQEAAAWAQTRRTRDAQSERLHHAIYQEVLAR